MTPCRAKYCLHQKCQPETKMMLDKVVEVLGEKKDIYTMIQGQSVWQQNGVTNSKC